MSINQQKSVSIKSFKDSDGTEVGIEHFCLKKRVLLFFLIATFPVGYMIIVLLSMKTALFKDNSEPVPFIAYIFIFLFCVAIWVTAFVLRKKLVKQFVTARSKLISDLSNKEPTVDSSTFEQNQVVSAEPSTEQLSQINNNQIQPTQAKPVVNAQTVKQSNQVIVQDYNFFGKSYRGNTGMTGTIFNQDYIQHGNRKFPYADLTEITILRMPSAALFGSARTVYKPENLAISITFYSDPKGFVNAVEYANEQIENAGGDYNGRKFTLKSTDGYKLEVYEDYILIKAARAAQPTVRNNSRIIMFPEISLIKNVEGNKLEIVFKNEEGLLQIHISYASSDLSMVNRIINYVNDHATKELIVNEEESWKLVTGTAREFHLLGKTLTVDERWDVFNSYRTMYMNYAFACSQKMKKKYFQQINDFDSFMKFYVLIYQEQLEKIIKRTNDILVSGGIWTETSESIMQRHIENYHLAMDDYTTMLESLLLTVQNNKEQLAAITSLVPNLMGGGFGVSGAIKGIATATAFNLVRDGTEAALIEKMNIRPAQKIELYGRIKPQVLFERAFLDMWRVFLTLIDIMNENGKDIWRPTDNDSAKADNIMKNLSNPNFPQDQLPDVMITVIGMDPYKRSIYKVLRNKGADPSEVKAISEYFGYTDNTPDCVG